MSSTIREWFTFKWNKDRENYRMLAIGESILSNQNWSTLQHYDPHFRSTILIIDQLTFNFGLLKLFLNKTSNETNFLNYVGTIC